MAAVREGSLLDARMHQTTARALVSPPQKQFPSNSNTLRAETRPATLPTKLRYLSAFMVTGERCQLSVFPKLAQRMIAMEGAENMIAAISANRPNIFYHFSLTQIAEKLFPRFTVTSPGLVNGCFNDLTQKIQNPSHSPSS